ncbi:MAG: hypothetical protein D3904_14075, partial [Candidatus Electrothrix sp. EH2]|nr:hypothetical protein [Candidatus Electrothrix sp. EH2]
MKARSMKKLVPIVFIVTLCGGGVVSSFAQEHGQEGHPVEPTAVHEQQANEHLVAHAAGETVDEHGTEHAFAEHAQGHGEHHAPMVTGAKLKDLFWRAVNFAVLVFILV